MHRINLVRHENFRTLYCLMVLVFIYITMGPKLCKDALSINYSKAVRRGAETPDPNRRVSIRDNDVR